MFMQILNALLWLLSEHKQVRLAYFKTKLACGKKRLSQS